jgi:SAM-dependent methyltransferase
MSPNFVRRYFCGIGLDVGGKPDPLSLYAELFPLMESVKTWDLEDGDAQYLEGVEDNSLDFVHSSHCLEHLHDPRQGLVNWFRVVRPGGFLIITVPDEDLYEQGVFPSTHNRDHKWTFTIFKKESWSARSINVLDLVQRLGESADVEKIELLNSSYRHNLPRYDQTLTPIGECAIELVIRKRTTEEIASKGKVSVAAQPDRQMRLHLNQYRDDVNTLKAGNEGRPPFLNDDFL